MDFDNDEVSTFGGLITNILGRFPEKGEKIRIAEPPMEIVVEKVSDRRIDECKIELFEADKDGERQ